MKLKKIRIGDLLIEKGFLTQAQLKVALNEQKSSGKRLGEVFVDLGYIDEDTMLNVIAEQLDLQRISMDEISVDSNLKKYLPENLARKFMVIPVKKDGNNLSIATNDPTNVFAIDEISRITKKEITPYVISNSELLTLLENIYGTQDKLFKTAESVEKRIIQAGKDNDFLENLAEDAPVVNLFDSILGKAVNEQASDIHVEPDEDKLRIRFRVDGILHEILSVNRILHAALISRIKIMSNMDIAEKRTPQDGRFKIRQNFKDIDFRVSTLPTNFGEKAVLRLLDRSKAMLDLKKIGMDSHSMKVYQSIVEKPYGIILISGPTGSGKTTTLYASLNALNSIDKNIVTVEDPIEYNFKIINQVQVDESAGVTFANTLRSVLRQDPDIIMVGEIRDRETAEISIQASLTGHLVLSTIHTNDAISSVTRLVDMGIENFLVATSVVGVVGQRLVRKVCLSCVEEYTPPQEFLDRIGFDEESSVKFSRGAGCEECRYTGYSGRIGIYEVLKVDSGIRNLVNRGGSNDDILDYAKKNGFKSMYESGLKMAEMGITTLEEVLRVTTITE